MTTYDQFWRDATENWRQQLPKLSGLGIPLTTLTSIWGLSHNYDSNFQVDLVDPELIDLLNTKMNVAPRMGRLTHAGVLHTFGYLLSNAPTKHGEKRMRWLKNWIEDGLGFSHGLFSPECKEGSFFANVSYLFSRIAFHDDAEMLSKIRKDEKHVSTEVVTFPYVNLKGTRILEKNGDVELRTDIIPFRSQVDDRTHLLVYSTQDQLFTGFPVDAATVASLLNPSRFGTHVPYHLKYNAYIENFPGEGFCERRLGEWGQSRD